MRPASSTPGDADLPSAPTDVKDLLVWQKAMALARAAYLATGSFPRAEAYGLTSQIRRAAVAIPSNLAEGRGRATRKDFRQFVIVARGSACELETQLLLAADLDLLDREKAEGLLQQTGEVLRMLNGLVGALGAHDG